MERVNVVAVNMIMYLLADLERGFLRSSNDADSLPCAAANLGDPTSLEGDSHREGDDATICLASLSHS